MRGQDILGLLYTAFGNPAGRRVAKAGTTFGVGVVGVVGSACEADLSKQRQQDVLRGWLARRATAGR